jgi:hypothetical protein
MTSLKEHCQDLSTGFANDWFDRILVWKLLEICHAALLIALKSDLVSTWAPLIDSGEIVITVANHVILT